MQYDKSFIEVQFPVSKVSKESYKERKAGSSQTLTGLGKWWGRKPLVLIRAALLGVLMPSSNNPKKDREIFLKILTMDEKGLEIRKNKSIPTKQLINLLTTREKEEFFEKNQEEYIPKYKKGINKQQKEKIQKLAFSRLSYDEKLTYCIRPEEVENLHSEDWRVINEHLGTTAKSLQELIQQLGQKKFGETPVIGDCFSGGGSIPFEAARMGANVYASDLNPVAMLLTWAAINIIGAGDDEARKLEDFQNKIFSEADKIITKWGIEHNENGWRANAYLYCNETVCPECNYKVPLSPTWIIGTKTRTIAKLIKNESKRSFDIEIIQGADEKEFNKAKESGTIKNYSLVCPNCEKKTPIPSIRKDKEDGVKRPYRYNTPNALRKWEQKDIVNLETDIFTERLYCIRYEGNILDEKGNIRKVRHYVTPTKQDLQREEKVLEILKSKFNEWQEKGYIPDSRIEEGWNTNQPIYEKGWTYWHHLYNPRQLLTKGLLMELVDKYANTVSERVIGLLGINKCANWNTKLSIWHTDDTHNSEQLFYNQAFNTLFNYCCRAFQPLQEIWLVNIKNKLIKNKEKSIVTLKDARQIEDRCHIWITDPPYADAVHYHELTELFLSWDKKLIKKIFPDWYTDSKRVLAVQGTGDKFYESMISIYKRMVELMPDNGLQVVMFTHQDTSVWAELAMILWSAGLQVTAAWNIATETESGGLKDGNYVKGTVLLVLRKQTSDETAYLDELYPDIEAEVKAQIDSMRELDDKEDPNYSDPDYLLAAYAASLKVLTSYKKIEDIDVKYELAKLRTSNEESPIEKIIQDAVKIAYDYLIPSGFDHYIWKMLTPEERFYIKGLELEKQNVYQLSGYQELARGFGVREYRDLLGSTRANNARLKTASEFAMRGLNDNSKFGSSLLRNVLVAIYLSVKEEDTMKGRNWLKTELVDYWNVRTTIVEILSYISSLQYIENMEHWKEDAYAASMLKELISNDGI